MSSPEQQALDVGLGPEWVVLKAKSYRQAQERQRVAEALRAAEERNSEHTRAWAMRAFEEERRLRDRCTYLYGLAARYGATDEELRGPDVVPPTARREAEE